MERRLLAAASALALVAALPALAQIGNPAGMTPGAPQTAPGMPAPHETNVSDRVFVQQATIGGLAEVEWGRLADQHGQDAAVQRFGRQMVDDHTKANQRLSQIAKTVNVPQPDSLDAEHRAIDEQLGKLNGAAFDHAYMQSQVQDHQKTVQLLEYEIDSGQNHDLKAFAREILPVVLQHLQMAQSVQAEIASRSLQASTTPESGSGTSAQPPNGRNAAEKAKTRELNQQELQKPESTPSGQ